MRYVDNNRKQLKKRYPDFESFLNRFEVPQSLIDEMVADGKKQKVEPKDKTEMQRTLPYLRTQLKALVARDIWGMNEYFQIINKQNVILQKALEQKGSI